MTISGRAVSATVRAVAAKKRLIPQKKAILLVCLICDSKNFKADFVMQMSDNT